MKPKTQKAKTPAAKPTAPEAETPPPQTHCKLCGRMLEIPDAECKRCTAEPGTPCPDCGEILEKYTGRLARARCVACDSARIERAKSRFKTSWMDGASIDQLRRLLDGRSDYAERRKVIEPHAGDGWHSAWPGLLQKDGTIEAEIDRRQAAIERAASGPTEKAQPTPQPTSSNSSTAAQIMVGRLITADDFKHVTYDGKVYSMKNAKIPAATLRALCKRPSTSKETGIQRMELQKQIEAMGIVISSDHWSPGQNFKGDDLKKLYAAAIGSDKTAGIYWIKP